MKPLQNYAYKVGYRLLRIINRLAPYPLFEKQHYPPRPLAWSLPVTGESPSTRIGLVTPSYNQGKFIRATLESVLSQRYANLDYVIQDNESTDETTEILRDYQGQCRIFVEKDSGQADAIACGFEKVNADVLGWLNSDDLLLPGSLHTVGKFFDEHPHVDVVYGNRILTNEMGKDIGKWVAFPFKRKLNSYVCWIPQETMFFRRSALKKAGGINKDFQLFMDWDVVARMASSGARVVYLNKFLGCLRVYREQKTQSPRWVSRGNAELEIIRQRELGWPIPLSDAKLVLAHEVAKFLSFGQQIWNKVYGT
jgi:glycosyltransferase involved in cell wall biosynthesis